MSLQHLAKTLFPLASATQPRRKTRSPFSPLAGWLATLWASKGRKKANKDHPLVTEPHHFTSPVMFHEEPKTTPIIHSTDTICMSERDDNDDHDASEMPIPLSQFFERRLTKVELDYVVDALLEYLEEGKAASPDSGREEYEEYVDTLAHTGRKLRHGLWSPASSMYVLYDNEDDANLSQADTLEMDETYDRASLELARSACYVPELRDSEDVYPYQFELEFEGEGSG